MVFQCINIRQVPVFNTSLGTLRMLMHEKPCLIPILISKEIIRNAQNSVFVDSKIVKNIPVSIFPVVLKRAVNYGQFTFYLIT